MNHLHSCRRALTGSSVAARRTLGTERHANAHLGHTLGHKLSNCFKGVLSDAGRSAFTGRCGTLSAVP